MQVFSMCQLKGGQKFWVRFEFDTWADYYRWRKPGYERIAGPDGRIQFNPRPKPEAKISGCGTANSKDEALREAVGCTYILGPGPASRMYGKLHEHDDKKATFSACSIGKGKWEWFVWNCYKWGEWADLMARGGGPMATGYASSLEETRQICQRYDAVYGYAGMAREERKRRTTEKRMNRTTEEDSSSRVEYLWTYYQGSDGYYNSPEDADAWHRYKILKRTEKYVYVSRHIADFDEQREIKNWMDYDEVSKAHRLNREKLEREDNVYCREAWEHFYTEEGKARFIAEHQSRKFESVAPALAALGLKPPCTRRDVKRAYRILSKQMHPDTGGDHEAFLNLQSSYREALRMAAQ